MANEIRIKTSVEVIQDNTETVESIVYTQKSLDGNSGSRSWGGSYSLSQAPADDKICYWTNAVIDSNTIDYLNNSAWTESADVTGGGIPTTAHVVAVEYVKTLGTVASVAVTLAGEVIALLTLGEAVVIPWHDGELTSSIGLTASAYSDGVN